MKFTIDKNIILENLMNVARAISTKNVIPVLNGIKFEMTEEGLYLTASDSELTIKSFIEKKDIKKRGCKCQFVYRGVCKSRLRIHRISGKYEGLETFCRRRRNWKLRIFGQKDCVG